MIFSVDEHHAGLKSALDSLYSNVARGLTLNGANVIVTATNDGWFDISTALNQHLSKVLQERLKIEEDTSFRYPTQEYLQ